MILPIIIMILIVTSIYFGVSIDRKAKRVLDPHTNLVDLTPPRHRRWHHKPTLAELEEKSRQMEIEAGIGPLGAATRVTEIIAENDKLLGDGKREWKPRSREWKPRPVTKSIDRNRMSLEVDVNGRPKYTYSLPSGEATYVQPMDAPYSVEIVGPSYGTEPLQPVPPDPTGPRLA